MPMNGKPAGPLVRHTAIAPEESCNRDQIRQGTHHQGFNTRFVFIVDVFLLCNTNTIISTDATA